jgi:hypothetical protein
VGAGVTRVLFLVVNFLIVNLLWLNDVTAQSGPPVPPHIKSIGVVTVVPSKIHIYRWGYLDTACDWLDITNLHVDKAAFDGAAHALSPKYKVVRTKVDRDAVIRTSNTEVMGAFKSFPSIGEQVRQISRPESQVDAYLLIWSSHSANTCDLRPGVIGYGFGVTKSLNSPPHLHTFAGMSLIDSKTLQIVVSRQLQPSYLRLDNFEWRDSLAAMSAQQRQLIQKLIPQMVRAGVTSTSRELLIAQGAPR